MERRSEDAGGRGRERFRFWGLGLGSRLSVRRPEIITELNSRSPEPQTELRDAPKPRYEDSVTAQLPQRSWQCVLWSKATDIRAENGRWVAGQVRRNILLVCTILYMILLCDMLSVKAFWDFRVFLLTQQILHRGNSQVHPWLNSSLGWPAYHQNLLREYSKYCKVIATIDKQEREMLICSSEHLKDTEQDLRSQICQSLPAYKMLGSASPMFRNKR